MSKDRSLPLPSYGQANQDSSPAASATAAKATLEGSQERYAQCMKRTEGEMTKAAKEIDRLRASAESTVAGREPNLNLC